MTVRSIDVSKEEVDGFIAEKMTDYAADYAELYSRNFLPQEKIMADCLAYGR